MVLDPLYEQIGLVIKLRRKKLGLKQRELAGKIGLSRGSLANIEIGRQNLLVHQLYKIASELGLEPIDLLPPMQVRAEHAGWSKLLPDGLKPQQRDQIARLLGAPNTVGLTQRRGADGKSEKK